MINNTITKIQVVTEPGAVFATAIESAYIELSNYKYIDFILSSGAGTAADIMVTIKGRTGSAGTAAAIPFKINNGKGTGFTDVSSSGTVLNVGGTAGACGKAIYRVSVDELASAGYDRVNINITAVASSTVPGCIIAVLYEPRYTE